MASFAIYYEPSAYTLKGKVMGRQSAGTTFMQAIANSRPQNVWCYSASRQAAQDCAQKLADYGAARTGVAWIPFHRPEELKHPGLLYRPDPGIESDAWLRLSRSSSSAYSICGITHTTATHNAMDCIARLPYSPLESWDALICTSRSVRDSVRTIIESQTEYLRQRVGANRFQIPQLPLIPLGIHTERFTKSEERRSRARARFGIEDDEIVFLFAGRLSFHGKAHYLPMYLGLEASAKPARVVLLQAGWFANESVERIYRAEAQLLCPSVRCIFADGRDQEVLSNAFSAADVFTSLSDNVQETFGITPIEAMAAGLPVVVSDWDGYKDTVRQAVDGFRVPTCTLSAGSGRDLAQRYDMGVDHYDRYCGNVSQLTAVNVSETAHAYKNLIENPDLRRRMGEAGASRARGVYDWKVIFSQYQQLWEELGERRRADARMHSPLEARPRPDRTDPFIVFSSYPTYASGRNLDFRRGLVADAATAIALRDLDSTSFADPILPSKDIMRKILKANTNKWCSFSDIVAQCTEIPLESVERSLIWLCKSGALEFRSSR